MPSLLAAGDRVLLVGDSITDWGRDRHDPTSLGHGYVLIAASLAGARHPGLGLRFVNRGISGDRVRDLRARWQTDVLALAPTVVSVMVGVNDTWRRYDSGETTSVAAYEDTYGALLTETVATLGARLVLVEPFLTPLTDEQVAWREDLDPKIDAVRRLAMQFSARLVPADAVFTAAAARDGARPWSIDGVHPTAAGHGLLATAWLDTVDA